MYLQASCEYVCHAIKMGPKETIERLEERHFLNNSPRIATDLNLGYVSTSQVNIADVQAWDSEKDLRGSLGSVGEAHWDIHDDPLGMTGMTCVSSLPKDYHPGFFYLLEFGLFITCKKYVTLAFSGLHRHGGTPPRAPRGVVPVKWATRVTIIWYPGKGVLDRTSPISLFKVSSKDLCDPASNQPPFSIEIPALHDEENIDIRYKSVPSELGSMVHNGHKLMTPRSHQQYLVRDLALYTSILLSQLPESSALCLDMDRFTSAFYSITNNEKCYTEPWTRGPNGSLSFNWKEQLQKLRDVSLYLSSFIPSVGAGTFFFRTSIAVSVLNIIRLFFLRIWEGP